MIEPRGYNCLLKVSADNIAVNILFLLYLLQELFTFSRHVTNIFSTPSLIRKVLFRAQSPIKLMWYVVPQPWLLHVWQWQFPSAESARYSPLQGREEKVDWSFVIHFWEATPAEQERQSLQWRCLVEVLLNNDTAWTSVCTVPCWQLSQSGQLRMG